MKILYIAGAGRSGSTILANILGEVDGFCSVGEIRHVWDGLINDWFCGCGAPLRECSFWTRVVSAAYGGFEKIDPAGLRQLRRKGLRSRHFVSQRLVQQKVLSDTVQDYFAATRRLYTAVCATAGCKVIIDSSKAAAYQYVLQDVLGFDVYTLHLVRDPRAVAYAWWYRRKLRSPWGNGELLDRHHPIESALRWYETNALVRRASARNPERYLLLRYEDFVADYQQSLPQVLEWLGADDSPAKFATDDVTLSTHHTVSGNPDRFQSGKVRISSRDEEWKSKMSYAHRLMVSAITWPELRKYRYPLV